MKKLLLIDGMASVYRGYYAMNRSPRVNSKGFNTSAALGFTVSLYDLLRSQRPTHIGVAFDLPKPTFRHELYPEYKAHRDPMPEEIQSNMPWICRVIEAFRIPQLTCEGFEADDVIGTVAHAAERAGFDEVVMVTPDKDFAQLVTERVHLYRYGHGPNPDSIMGIPEVCERFDVQRPAQVIDLLGLWGDAVDNIPGIRGVGEKTAKKLIAQFGSIEEMVSRVDEIKNDKLREQVRSHADDALFSKQLATIRLDAPIAFDEQALVLETPDYDLLHSVCDELEFRQFAKRVFTDLSVSDPSVAVKWNQNQSVQPLKQSGTQALKQPGNQTSLFDTASEPVPQPKPTVSCCPLTSDIFASLQGKDIALHFDGPNFFLATDADTVYTTTVDKLSTFHFPLSTLLQDHATTKLCFDLKNLKYIAEELGVTLDGTIFDVQLAHYLLDAEMRHSFDYICSGLLGFAPADSVSQVAALWQLYPLMTARLRDAGLESLYNDIELPLVDVLIDMEREGVRIDVDALRDYARRLTVERDDIEKQIFALAGHPFNISSPRQLGEVLYDQLKVTDRPPRTATKQYSTAEDVLQKLSDRHPVIPLILEYRSLSKLVGTYLDSFPRLISPVDHRLHTVYNQTVTATGRLSSSNPNLQNIPIRTERGREIRRAFVAADDDHLLLAADYSQIELRIIASLAHDRHLLHAFNSGYDIHAATAARIYGIPIDQVTKEQRRNAKSVNFGIVYGISAFGLGEQLSIPRKEAAALIDEYFAQYPDILAFIEQCKEFARSFAERNAVNMPIQGTSADMIKLAMVRIHRQLQQRRLRTKMILQVHDELVFDLYRPEEDEVRSFVLSEMQNALPLDGLEIEVGIDVGPNWLSAH